MGYRTRDDKQVQGLVADQLVGNAYPITLEVGDRGPHSDRISSDGPLESDSVLLLPDDGVPDCL
jgi:hypothetical protein